MEAGEEKSEESDDDLSTTPSDTLVPSFLAFLRATFGFVPAVDSIDKKLAAT